MGKRAKKGKRGRMQLPPGMDPGALGGLPGLPGS